MMRRPIPEGSRLTSGDLSDVREWRRPRQVLLPQRAKCLLCLPRIGREKRSKRLALRQFDEFERTAEQGAEHSDLTLGGYHVGSGQPVRLSLMPPFDEGLSRHRGDIIRIHWREW